MLTEFGKFIRSYRLEHGLILKQMADELGVPSSYLSAVEMGRKSVTDEFLKRILTTFPFSEEEEKKLKQSAALSPVSAKLNLEKSSALHRKAALSFARKFDSLDDETIKKIMNLLGQEDD